MNTQPLSPPAVTDTQRRDAPLTLLEQAAPENGCRRYSPGHNVHYIQARKAQEHPGQGRRVKIYEFLERDVVVLRVAGEARRYYNHYLRRLHAASDDGRRTVYLYEEKSLLRCGTYLFSIATPQGWRPCPDEIAC